MMIELVGGNVGQELQLIGLIAPLVAFALSIIDKCGLVSYFWSQLEIATLL